MKYLQKITGIALFLTLFATGMFAQQKFGHVNVGNLLEAMPATRQADTQLETYSKQLVEAGRQEAAAVQAEFDAFAARVQQGGVTPKEQQEKQVYFQNKQQELAKKEQEIQQKIALKRQELLEPLTTKLDTAIKEVGQEQGLTFIFDSSVFGAVLFSTDSADVTELVRAKVL